MPEEGIPDLVEGAMGDGCTLVNPREPTEEDFRSSTAGRCERRRRSPASGRRTSAAYAAESRRSLRADRGAQSRRRAARRCAPAAPTGSPVSSSTASGARRCDADEREEGGLFSKAVLPARGPRQGAHARPRAAMPAFNVESIEATPEDLVERTRLAAQGRVREHRLQQALPRDRPERVRPGRAARDVRPRLPRLGDDDRPRGRLRGLRAPALLPVAPARAQRGRARAGARRTPASCSAASAARWRSTAIHDLPGRPLARRARAVPAAA